MARRRHFPNVSGISHRDLLEALYEALEINGQEDRASLTARCFGTLGLDPEETEPAPYGRGKPGAGRRNSRRGRA